MPLDDRTAFKVGFLLRCAEAGLSGGETVALMEKAATLTDWYKRIAGAGTLAAGGVRNLGIAGLVAAAGAGAGGGLLAAHLRKGTVDPEEIKKQELIAAYNTYSDQLRGRQAPPRGQVQVPI